MDYRRRASSCLAVNMSRLSRQSFLGADSDRTLNSVTIGLIGLGGGGSHIVQQLAHIGIGGFVLVDPQTIDETNTNRLVGGTLSDLAAETAKVEIAKRVIDGLEPDARVRVLQARWQDVMPILRSCDIIIGAVDKLSLRDELERFTRSHLIPYIDIGMNVRGRSHRNFLISGQIIQSMPGAPCMRCLGFITPYKLGIEAERYGEAGANPQVVWPNGVLASTAVGLCIKLLTPWAADDLRGLEYLSYDGNAGIVMRSRLADAATGATCMHHLKSDVGYQRFKSV